MLEAKYELDLIKQGSYLFRLVALIVAEKGAVVGLLFRVELFKTKCNDDQYYPKLPDIHLNNKKYIFQNFRFIQVIAEGFFVN